jgi:ABC-type Na+ efflux pump permease subunit
VSGWRERAARVLRVARWEIERTAGVLDRTTAALGVLALVVVGGAVAGGLAGGVALDRDIYRVGVAADSPYREPVAAATALDPAPPSEAALRRGEVELLVTDGGVVVGDGPKAEAALAAFRDAVRRHNAGLLSDAENDSAAYPVDVSLSYVDRGGAGATGPGDESGGDGSTGGDAGAGTDTGDGTDDGGGGAGGRSGGDGTLGVPDVGSSLFGGGAGGSPANIRPPFPFASLVLAFLFLVPMNFVVQAYGGTMLNERVNRRGELLLVSPASPGEIVAGKTLPYLAAMTATTAVVAIAVGGGALAVAAVLPVALLFLAAAFVGAMFARSFKELTFVTVAISVFVTTYAFVPAIFTNVTPVALISPLTLVVTDLEGGSVALGEFLFATGPMTLGAGVLFLLGVGVYREEDMFTQRPVPLKFLDALAVRIHRRRSVAKLAFLSVPFVFIAELLAVAVLFALPVRVTVPLLLVVIAAVEEVAKSAGAYAGFANARFDRGVGTALAVGALSGAGFFVGEKATAVVQVVGLPELALGRAAFGPAGVGGVPGAGTALALLAAPLALHVLTAATTALGASRGRRPYAVSLAVATAGHALYNLAVVSALG